MYVCLYVLLPALILLLKVNKNWSLGLPGYSQRPGKQVVGNYAVGTVKVANGYFECVLGILSVSGGAWCHELDNDLVV